MITELTLENFQGFAQEQKVRLAPLTLIFGPNSSGKSSLIRSLLLMQQSLSGVSINHGLTLRGPSIDLASFSNIIHKHDLDNILSLGLKVPAQIQVLPSSRASNPVRHGDHILKNLSEISYSVQTSEEEIVSIHISYAFKKNDFVPALGRPMADGVVNIEIRRDQAGIFEANLNFGHEILSDIYAVTSSPDLDQFELDWQNAESLYPSDAMLRKEDWEEGLRSVRLRGLMPSVQPMFFSRSEQILVKISEILESLFRATRLSLARAVDGVTHVKPLRDIPERLLIVDETDSTNWRRMSAASRHRPSHDVVSDWIKKLTHGQYELRTEEFSSKEVGFLGTLRAKHLFDTKTKTPVSFKDVGVGLSQVLPIIEALEVAQRISTRIGGNSGRTTLIEQPELHLHPRMQADLMDLMVDVVLEQNSDVQVIAETHSENMVLRLQKRIREGKISPDKVTILYADQSPEGGNKITELALNGEGDFDQDWPLSFADVRVQDLF